MLYRKVNTWLQKTESRWYSQCGSCVGTNWNTKDNGVSYSVTETWKLVSYLKVIAWANGVRDRSLRKICGLRCKRKDLKLTTIFTEQSHWFLFQSTWTDPLFTLKIPDLWLNLLTTVPGDFSQGLTWTEREDNSSPLSTSDLKIS